MLETSQQVQRRHAPVFRLIELHMTFIFNNKHTTAQHYINELILSIFSVDVNELSTLLLNVSMKRKRFPELCSKHLSNTLKIELNKLVGYFYCMH
jgi:ribosomal protein L23